MIQVPPGVIDLRQKCILRLEIHVYAIDDPKKKEIQIWSTPPAVLEGQVPDPLRLQVTNPQNGGSMFWIYLLDHIEKPVEGPWVAHYKPVAMLPIDPVLIHLPQFGFRMQLAKVDSSVILMMPGANA